MGLEWQKIIQSLNFTIIANWINFAILVAVLSWLLYRPAKEFIQERQNKIKSRIDNAKEREQSAQELKEKRVNKLKSAKERRREIIEEAERNAEEIIEEGRTEAKKRASRIIEQAKKEAGQEKMRIKQELEKQYVDASLLGAEKILQREVNEEDQRKFLDSLFDEIKQEELDL